MTYGRAVGHSLSCAHRMSALTFVSVVSVQRSQREKCISLDQATSVRVNLCQSLVNVTKPYDDVQTVRNANFLPISFEVAALIYNDAVYCFHVVTPLL